jgi:hypothetical protein
MKVAVPMGYKTPTNQMHLFPLQKSLEPNKKLVYETQILD